MTLEWSAQLIQVFGDSKLPIEWAMGSHRCNILRLSPILDKIFLLKCHFDYISFTHVYRERNTIADGLSKEGAQLLEDEERSETFLRDPSNFYHRPYVEILRRPT